MPVPGVVCSQAAAAVLPPVQAVNPFPIAIEATPPAPRPPDPPPPPDSVPPLQHTAGPTQAWSALDCYWWATLARANTLADSSFVPRVLQTKADFTRFQRFATPSAPDLVYSWYASMSDRVYIGVNGTSNELQLLQEVLSHVMGAQLYRQGFWNATFAVQADQQAALLRPLLTAEGALRPICFIGHSYGAAVCPILGQLLGNNGYAAWNRYVSFGGPMSFTASAIQLFPTVQRLRFATRGDPVVFLPPPESLLRTVPGLVQADGYPGGDYAEPANTLLLDAQRGPISIPNPGFSRVQWLALLTAFLSGGAAIEPHFARSYARVTSAWYDSAGADNRLAFRDPISLDTINLELDDAGV